jgi:hypothetical protein
MQSRFTALLALLSFGAFVLASPVVQSNAVAKRDDSQLDAILSLCSDLQAKIAAIIAVYGARKWQNSVVVYSRLSQPSWT